MVIAFWSPCRGQSGTTTNMLLMAYGFARNSSGRGLIIQPKPASYRAEDLISGSIVREKGKMYGEQGISSLLMGLKTAPPYRELFDDSVSEIIHGKLDILKDTDGVRDIYEHSCNRRLIERLPFIAEQFYAYVFCDVKAGEDALSEELVSGADIIVVNLRQNRAMIEDALMKDFGDRAFYLFGEYLSDSIYTIANIRRMYRQISRRNSGTIPYCSSINDSASAGNLFRLMERYCGADRDYGDFEELRSVYEAADSLALFAAERIV